VDACRALDLPFPLNISLDVRAFEDVEALNADAKQVCNIPPFVGTRLLLDNTTGPALDALTVVKVVHCLLLIVSLICALTWEGGQTLIRADDGNECHDIHVHAES